MEKINVSKILKNCPRGMELDCACADNVVFDKIIEYEQIKCVIGECRDPLILDKYGRLIHICCPKCVIFPKGKTTWEGFVPPYEFKDGDIAITTLGSTAIIKEPVCNTEYYAHCVWVCGKLITDDIIGAIRFATESEKAELFQAIKDNGYRWNTKTKTLEKLMIDPIFKVGDKIVEKNGVYTPILIANVDNEYYYFNTKDSVGIIPILNQDRYELVPNKFDINTLVPFESRVLIRDYNTSMWLPSLWGIYIDNDNSSYPYKLIGTVSRYCIPYEGNEHLIGKTDDCNDFYKTWE